jgi:hypothetical protein
MKGSALTGGFRRALRAWPMALMLAAVSLMPGPALELRDRLFAADLGLGGFAFNISASDYYTHVLSRSQTWTLALLAIIWIFLSGGIIDRLARDTRSSASRFFAACGACFGPLIRLALLMLLVYAGILGWLEPWLAALAQDIGEQGRLALFGVLALILFAIAIVFDYARVRLVIEDRRSAVGAVAASFRLLRAHAGAALAIQLVLWLLLVLLITVRANPGSAAPLWLEFAFAFGELLLKLALIGAQVALYQKHYATAGWVARRDPTWPDEPSSNPAAI